MILQVKKKGVNIMLNTQATREMIEQLDPDAVIVAVGAEQIVPNIPGIKNKNVFMAADIFGKEDELGQKVVIIGGGMVGCEISIHLGEKGHQCTVVEMGEYIAGNAQLSQRIHILKFMEESKVIGLPENKCTKITEQGVYVVDADNQEKFLEADSVIICVGNKAKTIERDVFKDVAFDVINVGDCVKAGDIRTAVHSAWDAAATLGLEDIRIHN